MTQINQTSLLRTIPLKTMNLLLLIITLLLSLVTFLGIMGILMALGAWLILPNAENGVQQKYILITIRNFWLFFGGVGLLGFWIGSMDYHISHLGENKSFRILLRVLFVELLIAMISLIVPMLPSII